jgi:hypothetical protein
MSAVPMAWADFAQKIRGVAIYDILVPTIDRCRQTDQ